MNYQLSQLFEIGLQLHFEILLICGQISMTQCAHDNGFEGET